MEGRASVEKKAAVSMSHGRAHAQQCCNARHLKGYEEHGVMEGSDRFRTSSFHIWLAKCLNHGPGRRVERNPQIERN